MARNAPCQHDPRQPAPRPETVKQQVRRNLASRIADKEDPRAHSEDRVAEVQIDIHLQRRKANIDAVHVSRAITQRDQRNQPPGSLAHSRPANGARIEAGFCIVFLTGVSIGLRQRRFLHQLEKSTCKV